VTKHLSVDSSVIQVRKKDFMSTLLWLIFFLIPKNLMSYLMGLLSRLPLPFPFSYVLGKLFVTVFRINMIEAEKALRDYRTLEDIFTRRLAPNLRVIRATFCSPVDGTLTQSGMAENQTAIQAKGLTYSLGELVFGTAGHYDLSWSMTLYLAPHNYHRVHAPVSGKLREIRYFRGELWPVNPPFVKIVPRLFVQNERLVFEIEMAEGICYVVMVGALNVGRMVSPFWPEMTSNSSGGIFGKPKDVHQFEIPQLVKAGDELGTFMLGSTVIVVFDKVAQEELTLKALTNGQVVMGQALIEKQG
jgi:phosphatidylserine decarboxylase